MRLAVTRDILTLFSSSSFSLTDRASLTFSYRSLWAWNSFWAHSSLGTVVASRGPRFSSSRSTRYASYSILDMGGRSTSGIYKRRLPGCWTGNRKCATTHLTASYCFALIIVSSMVLLTSVFMSDVKVLTASARVLPLLERNFWASAFKPNSTCDINGKPTELKQLRNSANTHIW